MTGNPTAAEHRAYAWRLLDLAESIGDEEMRRTGTLLADVATMLDLGSEREPAADLQAAARHLRHRATDAAKRILAEDDAARGTR